MSESEAFLTILNNVPFLLVGILIVTNVDFVSSSWLEESAGYMLNQQTKTTARGDRLLKELLETGGIKTDSKLR